MLAPRRHPGAGTARALLLPFLPALLLAALLAPLATLALAEDSDWQEESTSGRVPDGRCATPYATDFSLLPEPEVEIFYQDGRVEFRVDTGYVRGAGLYVGLVPYGEDEAKVQNLTNGARFPEGLVDGPSSWPLDASDLCTFESETAPLYKVAQASYPLEGGIWRREVLDCLDVSYTAGLTFGELLELSQDGCSAPFFFTSARNGAYAVNGVLYVAYVGGTAGEKAEWSYPFYAENRVSVASCPDDMEVVLQVTKSYTVASVTIPVGAELYCNLSASIAALHADGSTGEPEPLTSTKFTCDCDFGCSNAENSYALQLPYSFGEDPIRQRVVYLDFQAQSCEEGCAAAEPARFSFVLQESYGVVSLGGSRGLRARLMRIGVTNGSSSGTTGTTGTADVQTVQVRLDGDGAPCSEEDAARGACRAAAGPTFSKAVLYKGDGSSVVLYEVSQGGSASGNASGNATAPTLCADYAVAIDLSKTNLRFSIPSSMVLLGNGVSTSPEGSLGAGQADYVKVWASSGSSGALSLVDLRLQPLYTTKAAEAERMGYGCTDITFGGCDFPGANCTEPNTTDPNCTDPNTTEPNTTEPNETVPNTTEPNGTDDNGTGNNGTDDNGTSGEKGAFGYRVARAVPMGLAALVAGLVLLLW